MKKKALEALLNKEFSEIKKINRVVMDSRKLEANDVFLAIRGGNSFVKEAYFKENYYYNGKFIDSVIYSLITPKK